MPRHFWSLIKQCHMCVHKCYCTIKRSPGIVQSSEILCFQKAPAPPWRAGSRPGPAHWQVTSEASALLSLLAKGNAKVSTRVHKECAFLVEDATQRPHPEGARPRGILILGGQCFELQKCLQSVTTEFDLRRSIVDLWIGHLAETRHLPGETGLTFSPGLHCARPRVCRKSVCECT